MQNKINCDFLFFSELQEKVRFEQYTVAVSFFCYSVVTKQASIYHTWLSLYLISFCISVDHISINATSMIYCAVCEGYTHRVFSCQADSGHVPQAVL